MLQDSCLFARIVFSIPEIKAVLSSEMLVNSQTNHCHMRIVLLFNTNRSCKRLAYIHSLKIYVWNGSLNFDMFKLPGVSGTSTVIYQWLHEDLFENKILLHPNIYMCIIIIIIIIY
jgi:hypothetical protein